MKLKEYPFILAKHYSSRQGSNPTIIVLHYSAGPGNAKKLGEFFEEGKRKASAHFGIGRVKEDIQDINTNICQYVPLDKASWHSGVAKFSDGKGNIGIRSIGIEICNRGYGVNGLPSARIAKGKHKNPSCSEQYWEKFTDVQYEGLFELIPKLKTLFPTIKYIMGHEDCRNKYIIPNIDGSKVDPGPLFDWNKLHSILKQCDIERHHYDFINKKWYIIKP